MNLEEIRDALDELDRQAIIALAEMHTPDSEAADRARKDLTILLDQRLAYMPKVAEFKQQNGMQPNQPDREGGIISKRRAQALELGLNPDYVENFMRNQFVRAKQVQKYCSNSKKE